MCIYSMITLSNFLLAWVGFLGLGHLCHLDAYTANFISGARALIWFLARALGKSPTTSQGISQVLWC
jgi:hypothetical protein